MKYKIILAVISILTNWKIANGQKEYAIPDIEKKYDFVEIWGLTDVSKKDFLTEIMSYPEGICEQSLTKMGLVDGNKLPIAFSNKIIVTTRNIPDYKKFSIYKKFEQSNSSENNIWNEFISAYESLSHYERQQLPFFLDLFEKNEAKSIDNLFKKTSKEFNGYGINLDKSKIVDSYSVYKKYSTLFTKENILGVLYSENILNPKFTAASFIALNYLKDSNDLLDFLPLLLKKKSGIQPIIAASIDGFNEKINWNQNIDLLVDLVNNPNPFQSMLALKVADKTGIGKKQIDRLLDHEMMTMKEILKSDFLPIESKSFLLTFLNKYSSNSIKMNTTFWIKKLR